MHHFLIYNDMSELHNHNQKTTSQALSYAENFLSDNVFFILAKRAEKITTALYMVTSFMDNQDPMQMRIRHVATDILSDMFDSITATSHNLSETLHQSLTQTAQLLSLVNVAHRIGKISEMNYHIIYKEISLLQSSLYREYSLNTTSHSKDRPTPEYHMNVQEIFKEEYGEHQVNNFLQNDIKDTLPTEKKIAPRKEKETSFSQTSQRHETFKRTEKPQRGESEKRRDLILSIIREKKHAHMKDIATRITNCTEKTLQRDLLSLIEQNVIEKKGEKRWSTYVLKS